MARPNYTIKIDSYSFGVLILHVFCGKWPFPTSAFQEVEGGAVPVTEVDRREEYFEKIGRDHPLSDLIRQCLSNMARQRPEASHLLQQINTVMARVVAPPETVIQQLESMRRENQSLRSEIQSLRRRVQEQPSSSGAAVRQPLRQQVERLSVHNTMQDGPPARRPQPQVSGTCYSTYM